MKIVIYAKEILAPMPLPKTGQIALYHDGVEGVKSLLEKHHDVDVLISEKTRVADLTQALNNACVSLTGGVFKVVPIEAGRECHHLHHHDVAIVSHRFRELLMDQSDNVHRAAQGISIGGQKQYHMCENSKRCPVRHAMTWGEATADL